MKAAAQPHLSVFAGALTLLRCRTQRGSGLIAAKSIEEHTHKWTLIMRVSRVLGALTATRRCFGTVIRANEDQALHLKAAFRKLHLASFGAFQRAS